MSNLKYKTLDIWQIYHLKAGFVDARATIEKLYLRSWKIFYINSIYDYPIRRRNIGKTNSAILLICHSDIKANFKYKKRSKPFNDKHSIR